jgi:glycosyltransferase involved in cell wall biosynthesis
MRIAFDYQIFGFQEYGGVSRYFCELSKEFTKTLGKDVAIVAPLYVNRYLKSTPEHLNLIGMSVPRLPKTALIYRMANSFLSWSALRYFRPDIVHETYYSSRRLAPRSAKVVLTVYDMIDEKFLNQNSISDTKNKDKISSIQRADHVICISQHTRQDVIELLHVDPAKTSVIHLGFTLTNRAESGQKRCDPLARPFLLYVGKRGGYKNFGRLLQVYAASPTLYDGFDLVCFGGDGFTSEEKTMLQQLGRSAKGVRHVSGEDAILAGLYSFATAFVYPSLYEGFGIPPLEAMNFDCPVVCSAVSSIPEVVGNAAEMFDPYDPDSMRTAIERVATDSALREALIARGRERIKQFSWERCARETLDVYSKVLS